MSGSRQAGRLNVLLAALLCLAGAGLGRAAFADPAGKPMQVLSRGAHPYTETMARMMARNRKNRFVGLRPRRPLNVLQAAPQGILPRVKATGSGEERVFPAPPFRGPQSRQRNNFQVSPSRRLPSILRPGTGAGSLLEIGTDAPQQLSTGFAGINMDDDAAANGGVFHIPPDTVGAAGPSHFVESVNTSVAVYNKTGTRLSIVSHSAFFQVVVNGVTYPRGGAFDPRVIFDKRSGRFFATTIETGSPQRTNNNIILAVSRTSDATGVWDKYLIPAAVPNEGTTTFFTDYTTLGVDDNGVYFAGTYFPSAGGSFAILFATPKAPLIAGSPSLGTVYQTGRLTDTFGTPQPAPNLDAVGPSDRAWFAYSVRFLSDIGLRSVTWNGDGNPPTFSALIQLSTADFQDPRAINGGGAPASGSTVPINTGDFRLQMAVIRNNRLWACRTIGVNSTGGASGADRNGCDWLEIDVAPATPTVLQNGRVFDPAASSPRFYYYPSLTVSGQGHVAMGYSGSRGDEFVGAYTSGRLATDPADTMQAIELFKAGEGPYTVTFGTPRNRWGDYSYTSVDPNDNMTIWTVQEYARPTGAAFSNGENGRWGTWVQRLLAPPPTLTGGGSGSGRPGQSNISLALTGTGFYDPGAAFPNRLAVTISGAGISTSGVTYNSPTSATALLSIAGNAVAGTRNIVLTNPDGQSATLSNAFTVVPFVLTSISPNMATPGGAQFTLTVNGSTFVNGDTVLWNGAERPTTFVSASQITAAIPASDIAASGSAVVTVRNPNGAASTNAQVIIIGAPQLKTVVTSSSRANGVITMNLNIANNGTAVAASVQLTSATLGSANASSALPALGDIAVGASVNTTLTFPESAGAAGTASVLRVRGTYTGGTFGSSTRVTLP